ncbi:SpoIIE family protein phosphatase [Streptomyces sp. FH025]|uniref:SpoIIE family protein phosphatase n=1 Tax=Streptomyces sp. FH025 TaxID=2815937 RepID=UPI001A9ED400|nr:SpoIIE family protein phosphatase [Streptomyces sp. FH025]MBO1413446.1 SpoIIE family protein phosphatase [Streptomyces sp. FH025]
MTAWEEPVETTARALAATVRRLQNDVVRARGEARRQAVVDLATGMLAERLDVLPTEASARLALLAREAGVPVLALAADIAGVPDATPEAAQARPGAQPLTAPALAAEPDLQRAADAVLEQTEQALGVLAVAIWQRLPGGALALAAHAGLAAGEAASWSRVPPGVDTPAQYVVGGGADLWPGDPATARPSVGSGTARAVLPLVDKGRRQGAFEVLWPGPAPALGAPQRRQLLALADLCATLLAPVRDPEPPDDLAVLLEGLPTPALLLEPVVRDGQVTDFALLRVNARFDDPLGRPREALEGTSLLETYPLACATGLFERLLRVHRTGVPLPGESVELVLGNGRLALPANTQLAVAPLGGRLLVGWRLETSPSDDDKQVALLRQAQRLARVAGFEESPDDGVISWSDGLRELFGLPPGAAPVPLRHLARYAHPDDEPAVRRLVDTVRQRHRTASGVFRLALPDGTHHYVHVIAEPVLDDGWLLAIRGAYHDVSAQHRTEVALDATQERLADSEHQTAQGEQLALRLQQVILPAAPPPLGAAGLSAAVRYRPAAQRDRVGGDWYDILPLPDERVLLAVGDVAGHGVGAATGMVALRHALRGLALTGAGPGRLLEWANRVALREPGQVTATAVCVVFDPAAGRLCWARAGHLPPIRFGSEGAEVLPLPHGVLLGALEEARYEERTTRLGPGDVLLLYTDGLVERRDRPVEESVDQLVRAAGPPGADLERYLDRLLDLSAADTEDDTCLIAVRVEKTEGTGRVRPTLGADPSG